MADRTRGLPELKQALPGPTAWIHSPTNFAEFGLYGECAESEVGRGAVEAADCLPIDPQPVDN